MSNEDQTNGGENTEAGPNEVNRTFTATEISREELARMTDDIIAALKTVYDPEIPSDIYEIGLENIELTEFKQGRCLLDLV